MVRRNTRRVCGRQVCNDHDSSRGFFATRARLGRSPNNNSTSSGGGGSLFLRLFDRLIVSDCLLSSNFSFLFFFPLSFEMEKLFEEQREAKGREQLFFRRIIFRLSLFLESGFFFKRFGFSRIKSNENPSIQQLSPNGIERCKSRWWPRTNAPIQIGKNFLAKRLACCNSS